jgi:hypothetical protein
LLLDAITFIDAESAETRVVWPQYVVTFAESSALTTGTMTSKAMGRTSGTANAAMNFME